jgi:hypothetical protein
VCVEAGVEEDDIPPEVGVEAGVEEDDIPPEVGAEAGVKEDEEVQRRMVEGDRAPALQGTAHSSPLLEHHF